MIIFFTLVTDIIVGRGWPTPKLFLIKFPINMTIHLNLINLSNCGEKVEKKRNIFFFSFSFFIDKRKKKHYYKYFSIKLRLETL